ncbi:hypothetical protein [Serratia fonticola]|uniref:hypothetical protein n=1 Tax=Serratia fonticola TaxID=47917 RepID=UPI00093A84F5|nr:hypothetical protein [Serratia fonticola]OKP27564.1 hypothetical protein BSQ40_14520 [Serratia fonticola]
MFDFPQPGEKYRLNNRESVTVIGILHYGLPHELAYRCPGMVWNPYRKPYSIVIRIEHDGRIIELPLGRFLRDYECIETDMFKRNPANRHTVLKEIAHNAILNAYRDKTGDRQREEPLTERYTPQPDNTWQDWQSRQHSGKTDNYRHYL